MALNFRPPTEIINAYLDSQNRSLPMLNQTLQNISNDQQQWYALRQRDRALALQAQEEQRRDRNAFYLYGDPAGLTQEQQSALGPVQGPVNQVPVDYRTAQQAQLGASQGPANAPLVQEQAPKFAGSPILQYFRDFHKENPQGILGRKLDLSQLALVQKSGSESLTPETAQLIMEGKLPQGNVPEDVMRMILTSRAANNVNRRFGENMDWRRSVKMGDIAEDFRKSPETEKPLSSLNEGMRVKTLIDRGTPLGDVAIQRVMPRVLGDVGNMAVWEQKGASISPSLVNKAKSLYQSVTEGKLLTERDRKDLSSLMDAFITLHQKRIYRNRDFMAKQVSKNFGVPIEEAQSIVGNPEDLWNNKEGNGPSSVQTISTQTEYDALPRGTSYSWKGQGVKVKQ